MNKEIIKAMNRQPKKENKFRKWWRKNAHIVARIVFFPIWAVIVINQKIEIILDKHNKWNEERADEILQYYIPRRASWDNENKEFYFFDNGFGWDNAKKYLKIKDRRFWNNHHGWCGGKIRHYLINQFELEGFTKEVIDNENNWTEIVFKIK